MLNKYVDILAISETKIDDSFPESQFVIDGYKKPYRLDISGKSGGLLVYVNKDIPSKQVLSYKLAEDMQVVPVEINLRKQKWLIIAIYKPPRTDTKTFLNNLSNAIDFYNKSYDNIIIVGDFNSGPNNPVMTAFLSEHHLFNHMKNKTCFKSEKGSCIDLILSNKKHSLQHTGTVDTGISDHHHLIYTMLKTTYTKLPPKKITYRVYKDFDRENFLYDLESNLFYVNDNYSAFEKVFTNVLNKHAPLKTKFLRSNNKQFVTKELRKAIMKRTYF